MQSKYVQNIVKNLERWRVSRNLSQADMAKRINISVSRYNKLVSGERANINVEMLKDIYIATGKQCFQLMEFIDDDYLKMTDMLSRMTRDEWHLMRQIIENIIKMRDVPKE